MTDECQNCHETIVTTDHFHWTHDHGYVECFTGDGSTAYPIYKEV